MKYIILYILSLLLGIGFCYYTSGKEYYFSKSEERVEEKTKATRVKLVLVDFIASALGSMIMGSAIGYNQGSLIVGLSCIVYIQMAIIYTASALQIFIY